MGLKADLDTEVLKIFKDHWTRRNGNVVPSDDSIKLGNDGVDLEATVLYADLADSTQLVDGRPDTFAAEIYKAFLLCAGKIIRSEGGVITAYDGDRIMAVFIGDMKNTIAARTALKINWAAKNIVMPNKNKAYNSNYELRHVVGVDTSKLLVARTGVRGANDLVWVGRAANHAAKMAALSEQYPTYISSTVYDKMHDDSKYGGNPRMNMWTADKWTGLDGRTIYKSSWWWKVD